MGGGVRKGFLPGLTAEGAVFLVDLPAEAGLGLDWLWPAVSIRGCGGAHGRRPHIPSRLIIQEGDGCQLRIPPHKLRSPQPGEHVLNGDLLILQVRDGLSQDAKHEAQPLRKRALLERDYQSRLDGGHSLGQDLHLAFPSGKLRESGGKDRRNHGKIRASRLIAASRCLGTSREPSGGKNSGLIPSAGQVQSDCIGQRQLN